MVHEETRYGGPPSGTGPWMDGGIVDPYVGVEGYYTVDDNFAFALEVPRN